MNNVYVGIAQQVLPANGAIVSTDPIDTTYMTFVTVFLQFTQTAGAGNPIMTIESSSDGGVTWDKLSTMQFDTIAADGTIKLKVGNALYEFPAKSDAYALPINVFGCFTIRFSFAMQSAMDPPGTLAMQWGMQLATPP